MREQKPGVEFQNAYVRALGILERGDAAAAERELREIQQRWPGELNSRRALALSLLAQGRNTEGIDMLEAVVAAAPDFAHAMVDLARAYRAQGLLQRAAALLRKALGQDAKLHEGWRLFGDLLANLGEFAAAKQAFQKFIDTDAHGPIIQEAAACLAREDGKRAEAIFRRILHQNPHHIGALCGLAAISMGAGYPADAQRLLKHALQQSAHMPLIRRGLAQAYLDEGELEEAEAAVRHSLLIDGDSSPSWVLLGSVLAHSMRQEEALDAYTQALNIDPKQFRVELSRGHVLKTLGRRAAAEAAYRRSLELQPDFGEAYYSFADLKNYHFSDDELAAMQEVLQRAPSAGKTQAQIHFAIGRAFEQRRQYPEAFRHYASGNSMRRRDAPFDITAFEEKCRRVAATFNAPFLKSREGCGNPDPAPIFVVGLPRSGSTLVEQVLASHSCIEGTMELPHVLRFVRELDNGEGTDAYPESITNLSGQALRGLGERYIKETRLYRSDKPRYIDKMPNNFSHVGLLQLILPKATIIDVRRNPMDTCFSAYKQHFAQGQSFTYDLDDLGRYYRSYIELMDHWDEVLPGTVFHVAYEDLVRNTETVVRQLIAHCGLEFEPSCLRFHETQRSVRTASSEQVRLPMYDSSIGQWRHFEAELRPLKQSLGAVLARFPEHE
ncbi:MAG TPA: sulfotransferase [Steroidobacteraceae bacterium]|jgi:tetratricopeptide (TPR) repeat protein